jgi:16S rRNA (guanine1207-N2)-methyltransferase
MAEDVFFNKIIAYRHCRQDLRFRVSQDLFSSFKIDTGTRFLMRAATPNCSHDYRKILDLGCGYGPIGLTLKALRPDSEVHMVDSDALAVNYARRNAELNGLTGVKIYVSLDYDNVTQNDFDLIISNIPGKAGAPVIAHVIEDAVHYLNPRGSAAVVVVSPLETIIAEIIGRNKNIRLLEHIAHPGHAVFRYAFASPHPESAPPVSDPNARDTYYQGSTSFTAAGIDYTLETAHGLPEFDRLSYATQLLADGLHSLRGRAVKSALVCNPLAGHVPVILWKTLRPEKIALAGRDLLALKYSARNLRLNGLAGAGPELFHIIGLDAPALQKVDLIAGVLREEEGGAAIASLVGQAEGLVSAGGVILLSAGATAVTRIAREMTSFPSLHIKDRQKYRGYSLLVLEKKGG